MLSRSLMSCLGSTAAAGSSIQLLGPAAMAGSMRCFSDKTDTSMTEKVREKVGEMVEKVGEAFKEDGSVGRQFTPEGSAGGTAQEVGGPFDKDGRVGHKFTTDGGIGGTVERAAEAVDEKGTEMQKKAAANSPDP